MKPGLGAALLVATILAGLAGCKQTPQSLPVARKCLQDHDLPCAEANLRGYLKHYPHDARDTGLLAIILTQEGKDADAIVFDKAAIGLGVKDDQLDANYASSLAATGDIAGAIAQNRNALVLNPLLVDVAATLAGQLNQTGKPQEAIDALTTFDANQQARGQPPHFASMIAVLRENVPTAPGASPPPPIPLPPAAPRG